MIEMRLEEIKIIEATHRASRPRLTEKQAHNELIEAMARLLHYQDSGEPGLYVPTEVLMKEYSKLPEIIINRYRHDIKFRAQVERAVAIVLDIWNLCSERTNDDR